MKRSGMVLGALLGVILGVSAKADGPVFGNSPIDGNAFSIVTYNQLSFSGAAVEFTPLENIDLSSVTLWLSGYNGQYGQTIDANIWLNNNSSPASPYIGLSTPVANNGSLASFTFSNPTGNLYSNPSDSLDLLANTAYWLVVASGGSPGNYISAASWANGGSLSGDATLNGSATYNVYASNFSPSTALPAFSINSDSGTFLQPVPEPGSAALMSIPLLLGISRAFWKRARA
jgi:hypothetical protein